MMMVLPLSQQAVKSSSSDGEMGQLDGVLSSFYLHIFKPPTHLIMVYKG